MFKKYYLCYMCVVLAMDSGVAEHAAINHGGGDDVGWKTKANFQPIGWLSAPTIYEEVTVDYTWEDMLKEVDGVLKHEAKLLGRWSAQTTSQGTKLEQRNRTKCVYSVVWARRNQTRDLVNEFTKLVKAEVFVDGEIPSDGNGRGKRSFASWIGTIISWTLGISNNMKIGDLQTRQGQIHHDQVITRQLEKETRESVNMAFAELSYALADDKLMEVVTMLHLEAQRHLRDMLEAVYQAMQGTVSHVLLRAVDLEKVEAKLRSYLSVNQAKVAGDIHILAMAKSVVVTSKLLRVMFHVPVVRRDISQMVLYQVNKVELSKDNTVVEVVNVPDYLGVSSQGYLPMTVAQLQQCDRASGGWICPGPRVLERTPRSCLSAMYRKSKADLVKYCTFEKRKVYGDYIHHEAGQRVSGRADRRVKVTCGQRIKVSEWKTLSTRTVPEDCYVESDDYLVLPYPVKEKLAALELPVVADNVTDSVEEIIMRSIDNSERKIVNQLKPLEQTPVIKDLSAVGRALWIYIAGGVASFVVFVCGIGMCFYRRLKKFLVSHLEGMSQEKVPSKDCSVNDGVGAGNSGFLGLMNSPVLQQVLQAAEIPMLGEVAPVLAGLESLRLLGQGQLPVPGGLRENVPVQLGQGQDVHRQQLLAQHQRLELLHDA